MFFKMYAKMVCFVKLHQTASTGALVINLLGLTPLSLQKSLVKMNVRYLVKVTY